MKINAYCQPLNSIPAEHQDSREERYRRAGDSTRLAKFKAIRDLKYTEMHAINIRALAKIEDTLWAKP
jgi:hypothetical protein